MPEQDIHALRHPAIYCAGNHHEQGARQGCRLVGVGHLHLGDAARDRPLRRARHRGNLVQHSDLQGQILAIVSVRCQVTGQALTYS